MTIDIKNVWYNPANAAFEGRIDIQRNGKSFRYPCSVEGPMTLPMADVRRRMTLLARAMSDSPPSIWSKS